MVLPPAWAHSTPRASSVQRCVLGDLELESGAVIRDFAMTFVAFGKLNAQRSNLVLSLHGLRGDRNSQSIWAEPRGAFDPTHYFVVQPDTLGACSFDPNATTSPTRSGLNMAFPRFTVRDMVDAEYRVLTECLGVRHVVAVTGTSMGGMEAYQWAVSYPDFMDVVVPIVSQPRATRKGNHIWELARRVIMLDPRWKDGDYPNNQPPGAGISLGVAIQEAFGAPSMWFEAQFTRAEEVHAALAADQSEIGRTVQPRDWMYRTWAIETHDISAAPRFKGGLAAAARSIEARLLVLVNRYDELLPARESGNFEVVQNAQVARLVDIADTLGHGGSATHASQALIAREIRELLAHVQARTPGIPGARFPIE
jgi:homoserine O-acetyltransferase